MEKKMETRGHAGFRVRKEWKRKGKTTIMGYIETTNTIRIRSFVPSEPQAPQACQGGLGSPASVQSSERPASGFAVGSKLFEGAAVAIGFCVM